MKRSPRQKSGREVVVIAMAVSEGSTEYRFQLLHGRQYHQDIVYIDSLAANFFFSLDFFPIFRLFRKWLQLCTRDLTTDHC